MPAYALATPSATSKRLRKSTSLPKLKKKVNTPALSELEVPESVEEKRESVLLPEEPPTKQSIGEREAEQRTLGIPAEELKLDKEEVVGLRKNPHLVVEEPTPVEEVVTGRESEE